jgi:hypothetical protein
MIGLVDEGTTCELPLLLNRLQVKEFFESIFTIALLGLWMGESRTNNFDTRTRKFQNETRNLAAGSWKNEAE